MTEFSMELSTKIYFGTGITQEALEKEKHWFDEKNILLITTGRSLIKYGYLERVEQILKKLSPSSRIVIYDKVSQNPRLSEVKEASELGIENNVQVVIGFGGGSALDAAKAVAAGVANIDLLDDFLVKGLEPTEKTLPMIAIPTTAGTGSELSKAAILSSHEHHIKSGIRGKYMQPKVAIVDAVYTWSVPERITMETGFDVLAHAVESYVAVKANLFSEMLSEKAIRIVGESLSILKKDLDNHEAREQMAFASMIMGMNLANVGTALPHRMQYPIGIETDTSHGAGLIALYPSWIQHEQEVNPKKVQMILEWLGLKNTSASDAFKDLKERWGISYTLQSLGIEKNRLSTLTEQVTGNVANDKLASCPGIINTILEESFS